MTILDRYLLRRYWHVFCIGFLSLFGLFFVIDLFTNVNDFFDKPGGALAILEEMATVYAYRACWFFGIIGGTMEVIAAMAALALMQKYGELNPVLAAGISTFRLIRPLMIGAAFINALIFANQELVIPRIAVDLQMNSGSRIEVTHNVQPVTDFATDIMILGKRLNLKERSIEEAEFILKPKITDKPTTILAAKALPVPPRGKRRGGWLLRGTSQKFDALQLTELGAKVILPSPSLNGDEFIVLTDVGFDQLYSGDTHYEYLSTRELMRRIKNPSYNLRSIRSQSLYLHTRFTKPLLNLIVVAIGVPFVVRKESVSLLTNLAICSGVMGMIFACNELFQYLGKVSVLTPELAVWCPIILWGSAAAWLMGMVRT
jgi:lipopolysaccharide export system permease protein